MILNIAYFTRDLDARKALNQAADIRAAALKLCYMIPGYTDFSLHRKNAKYDHIRALLETIQVIAG